MLTPIAVIVADLRRRLRAETLAEKLARFDRAQRSLR